MHINTNINFRAKMDRTVLQIAHNNFKASENGKCSLKDFAHIYGELECMPGDIYTINNKKDKNNNFYYFCDTMKSPQKVLSINKNVPSWIQLKKLYSALSKIQKSHITQ